MMSGTHKGHGRTESIFTTSSQYQGKFHLIVNFKLECMNRSLTDGQGGW